MQTSPHPIPDCTYHEGHPRTYHFDACFGLFRSADRGETFESITFQPLSWRFFTDSSQNRTAELFFVDGTGQLSSLLVSGYGFDKLLMVVELLFFADQTLADSVLTAIAFKPQCSESESELYGVAFRLEEAAACQHLRRYASTLKIYNQHTVQETTAHLSGFNYWLPPALP